MGCCCFLVCFMGGGGGVCPLFIHFGAGGGVGVKGCREVWGGGWSLSSRSFMI